MGLTEEQVRAFFRGERRPGVTTAAPRPVAPPVIRPSVTTGQPRPSGRAPTREQWIEQIEGGIQDIEQEIKTAAPEALDSLRARRDTYNEMLRDAVEKAAAGAPAAVTPQPQAMQQDTLDEADVRRFFRGEPAPTTAPKEGFFKRYTSGPLNRGARAPQGADPLKGAEFDVDPVTGLPQHSTEKVTKELYPQAPIGAAQGFANVGSAFSNMLYKLNPPEFMQHMIPSPEQATETYRAIGNILPAESPEAITGRTLGRLGSEGMMLSKMAGAARGFLPSTMNPILSRVIGAAASTPVSAAIGAGQQESSTAGFLSEMMPQSEWLRGVAEDPSKRGAFEALTDVVTSVPFELFGVGPELNAWKRTAEQRAAMEAAAKIPRLPPGPPTVPNYPRTDIGAVGSAQHAAARNIGIQDLLDEINKPPQTLEEVRVIEQIMRNAEPPGPVRRDVTGAVIPPEGTPSSSAYPPGADALQAAARAAQGEGGGLEAAARQPYSLPSGPRVIQPPDVPVARTQPFSTAQDVGGTVKHRGLELPGQEAARSGPGRVVPPKGLQPRGTPPTPRVIEESAEPGSYSTLPQMSDDLLRKMRREAGFSLTQMGRPELEREGAEGTATFAAKLDAYIQSLRNRASQQRRKGFDTAPDVGEPSDATTPLQPIPPSERPAPRRGLYPPSDKPTDTAPDYGDPFDATRGKGSVPPRGTPPPEEPPPPAPAKLPPKGPPPAAGAGRPRFTSLPDAERKALVNEFLSGESNPEGASFNWWLENVKGITPRAYAEQAGVVADKLAIEHDKIADAIDAGTATPKQHGRLKEIRRIRAVDLTDEPGRMARMNEEPEAAPRKKTKIDRQGYAEEGRVPHAANAPLRAIQHETTDNLQRYYDNLVAEDNALTDLEHAGNDLTDDETARLNKINDTLDAIEEELEARGVNREQYSESFAKAVAEDEPTPAAPQPRAEAPAQQSGEVVFGKRTTVMGEPAVWGKGPDGRIYRLLESSQGNWTVSTGSSRAELREIGKANTLNEAKEIARRDFGSARTEAAQPFTRAENLTGDLEVPQAKLHGQLVKKKDKLAKATTPELQRYIEDLEREFGDLNDLELAGVATELEAAVLKRRIREVEQTMDNVEQVLGARDVAAPEPAARQPEPAQPTSRRLTPSILEQIDDEELEELFQEYMKEADAIHRKPPWTRTKQEDARQEFLDHQLTGIRAQVEMRKNRPIRRDEPTEQARREYGDDDLDFDRDEVVSAIRTAQEVSRLAQEQLARTKLGKGARRDFLNDQHRATQTIDGYLNEYADKFGDDIARDVAREAGVPEADWPDRLRLGQEDLPVEPGRAPFVDAEGKPRTYAQEPETAARAEEDPLTDYTEDAPLPRTKKNAEAGGYDFEYNGEKFTIFYSPAMKRWSEVTPQGNVKMGVTKDETIRSIMDRVDERTRVPGEEKKPRTQRMTASRRQKKIDDLHTRWAEQMRQLWTETEANSWSRGRVSQASKRVNVIEDELRTLGAELPDTDVVVWREMQRAIAADEAATRFGLNERVADELRRIEELPDDELLRLSEAADSKAKQANPESLLRRAAYAGEAKKRGLIESRPGHVDKELLRLLGTSSLSGIVGAGIGANIDDEDRSRGALVGALTAMAVHAGVVGAGKSPSVRSFMRDWFKSGGDVPEAVWRAREGRDARRAVFELDYKKRLAEFRHALRGLNIPKEQITAVLQGGAMPKTWPKSVQEAVTGMRADIDAFSQRGIDEDLYIGPMAETVELGKGKYTSRAYQVFSDPRWEGKVTNQMRAEAAAALKQEHPEWDANRIKAEIESMTRGEDDFYRPGGGRTMGAQDVTTLKSRSQMLERQPALRRLMGEHTDPEIVYTQTMERLGDLLENQQFQQEVLKAGVGKWLFKDKTPGHVHEIQGLRQGSPLQGRFTTQRIKDRFKEVLPEMQQETHPVWREILRINAVSKFGKTVGSISTQLTNFLSNSLVAMANGHINPKTFVQGAQQVRKNTARYRRYVQLGVAGDAPHAGELREMQTQLAQSAKTKTGKIVAQGIEKLARKPVALATTAYRLGDEFWKINGFESNLKDLRKAYPKKPIDELEREAAEITRNTYHTYSRAPRAIQGLRKLPVLGAFPTFSAETARTMKNIVKQIHKEWQTPATRFIAVKRFAGLMAAAAAPYALAETSRHAFGVSEQEDADNRRYLSPFQRNNDLLYLPFKDKDGKQKFIDISRMDPYQYLRNVPNALMRGADKGSKVEDISIGLARPFLGIEPLAQSLVEAASNKKLRRGGYGGPVYNETSSFLKRQAKKIGHVGKALTPEVLKQGYAVAKAPFDEKTTVVGEGSNMLGLRIRDTDFGQGMTFKARDADKDLLASQNAFIARLADDNNVSDAVLRQTYRRMDRSRRRTFDALSRDVRAALRSGIDETVIREKLQGLRFSRAEADALLDRSYIPYQISDQKIDQLLDEAVDDAQYDRLQQRFEVMREEFERASGN